MDTTERNNYQWVNDLQQNGSIRLQAIAALRERLERGIYHYLIHERSDLVGRSDVELRQITQEYAGESLRKVLDNLALFRGTSQFTIWAAKLAARVSTTGLKCTDATRLAPAQSNPDGSRLPEKG